MIDVSQELNAGLAVLNARLAQLQMRADKFETEPDEPGPDDAAQEQTSTNVEQAQAPKQAVAEAKEWEVPAHEEINLATVIHEDLGLDPYNYSDPLVRKIYEAYEPKIEESQNTAPLISEPRVILQPDLNGEFPTPLDGALWMAGTYGIPQTPLRGKAPFLTNWPDKASADPEQIRRWAAEYPGCNFGSVAFAGKHFIFEADGVSVRERFKNQNPGHDFTSRLIIESSPGKGHRYYLAASGVENIGQDEGEDYSVRANNEQCVSPGSIHPVTGKQYRVAVHNGSLTQPTAEEVRFWKNGRPEEKSTEPQQQAKIPQGKRNSELAKTAGKLLDAGLSPEQVKDHIREINEERCEPPLTEDELKKTIFHSIDTKWSKKQDAITRSVTAPGVIVGGKNLSEPQPAQPGTESTIPIIDDPSDDDPRFEMKGDTFDTKVYEDMAHRFTPYPNPGDGDWISLTANKLVHGTSIPLGFVREPLKAIALHALDGKLVHPAHPKLSMRGNYFSLAESEGGKTTGLEFAIESAEVIGKAAAIHFENLFRYKSETTFIRSFTQEGTIKRDSDGKIKSGEPGHPSQFLYIKEGNLVANASDYFAAVVAMLTNLYDQTEAGTESMTNGNFTARSVRVSTVMCFTPSDFKATFGGKGTIGGGVLNRWAMVNPPPITEYDSKDWERLSDEVIQQAVGELTAVVFNLRSAGAPIALTEEPGAAKIRLEVKTMLKKAGKVGKRLMDYFMREQVAQAATAVDGRLVMTTEQALYAKNWVEAQMECRLNHWPSDANNQIEAMEHAIRKAVTTHHVSETSLKDACNFYREGSGGWFVFSTAVKNAMASEAIKWTGKTRKGAKTYCPGFCAVHPAIKEEEKPRKPRE